MNLGWETKTAVTAVALGVLWLGEACLPFYTNFSGRWKHRLHHGARNLGLGLFNAALLLLAAAPVLAAAISWTAERKLGLARILPWPSWAETSLLFVLLDGWMYVWHRANHTIPLLWRFHRVHHSDPEMDVSTAVRFHTGEAVLSAMARLVILALLGMSLWQLAVYELVFVTVVFFHHSNVRVPRWLDRGLLAVIVTPAMHRVHHSRWRPETNSNYGSVFPYWDYLAGTFRLRSDARTVRLGLDGMDAPAWQSVWGMLKTPLASVHASSEAS